MDVMHAKALSDLRPQPAIADDAFYVEHGCAWLQAIKAVAKRMYRPDVRDRFKSARLGDTVEP